MNEVPRNRIFRNIGYVLGSLLALSVIAFVSVGIREARRAKRLRDDICKLELGTSTFADVSRIFPQYAGYVRSHDDVSSSCTPAGCFYVLYVENPIPKLIPVFPRTGLFATVRISENRLRARSLSIAEAKGQRSREAFVQQSADSHFKEDTRIITESKMPRKGAAVAFENSARFVELANELKLDCLVVPGLCPEPDDMLPFLRKKPAPD